MPSHEKAMGRALLGIKCCSVLFVRKLAREVNAALS